MVSRTKWFPKIFCPIFSCRHIARRHFFGDIFSGDVSWVGILLFDVLLPTHQVVKEEEFTKPKDCLFKSLIIFLLIPFDQSTDTELSARYVIQQMRMFSNLKLTSFDIRTLNVFISDINTNFSTFINSLKNRRLSNAIINENNYKMISLKVSLSQNSVISEHFNRRLAIGIIFDVRDLTRIQFGSPVVVTKRRISKSREIIFQTRVHLFIRTFVFGRFDETRFNFFRFCSVSELVIDKIFVSVLKMKADRFSFIWITKIISFPIYLNSNRH